MARKVLLLVLVVLLAVSFVAVAQKKKLVHYHWTETLYDPINKKAADTFMAKNPNVEVVILYLPDNDRPNIIRTVLAGGGSIDSFALNNGESAEFLEAGYMVPLDPKGFGKAAVQDVVNMWTPGAINTCGGVWDDVYYGIPFELSDYVAWINTAFMKEAGLAPATGKPKTWPDVVTVGKKLMKVEGGVVTRNGIMCNAKEGVFPFLVQLGMMTQLGLDWGSEKGLVASMDKPDVLARGLRTFTDFAVKDKIWDPALIANDREGFGTGKSAIFLTGGTWYWGVADYWGLPRANIEPFPYPRFPGGKDIGGVGYGYCLYVSKFAKDPTLAFQFLDTLASQPNEFIKVGYHQPRVKLSDGSQGLDVKLAAASIPYYDSVFKGELAKTSVWLVSTKGNQVRDIVWQAISSVLYSGAKVEDAVKQMQGEIKALYK